MKKVYFMNADLKPPPYKRPVLIIGLIVGMATLALLVYLVVATYRDVLHLVDSPKASAQETPRENAEGGAAGEEGEAAPEGKTEKKVKTFLQRRYEEDKLAFREKKIAEVREEVLQSLMDLETLQRKFDEKLAEQTDDNKNEQFKQLAKLIKIVGAMRPEEAAKIIPEMEESLAVKVLLSLSGAKSSKIMGSLPSKKAASISARMVKLNPDIKLKDLMDNWKGFLDKEKKKEE